MTFRIIGDQRERGIAWAVPRFPHHLEGETWDKASALILERDNDTISAVVLYNNYYPGNACELSVAAADGNWLNRAFLSAVFRTPFIEWGMRRVTSRIASDNAKSIRFIEHLGFRLEGRIREGFDSETDCLIYGLLKRECRYLGNELNVERITSGRAESHHHGGSANCV